MSQIGYENIINVTVLGESPSEMPLNSENCKEQPISPNKIKRIDLSFVVFITSFFAKEIGIVTHTRKKA